MITIDDLRNPKRASGFNYVSNAQSAGGTNPLWCAKKGRFTKGSAAGDWHGPCRRDPAEAAQDYCDYINGLPPSIPSVPRGRAGVKRAGHKFDGSIPEIPSDIEAAYGMIRDFQAQQKGKPGYVYLIIEEHPGGALVYGKVGYSTNPQKRVAELQTGNPRTLRLYATKLGSLEDERQLHERHIKDNVLQEWFRITPNLLVEWDVDDIIKEDA